VKRQQYGGLANTLQHGFNVHTVGVILMIAGREIPRATNCFLRIRAELAVAIPGKPEAVIVAGIPAGTRTRLAWRAWGNPQEWFERRPLHSAP